MEEKLEKTLGEVRVRTEFNASGSTTVDKIKGRTAELINYVNSLPSENNSEQKRLVALALTAYEEAAMWAVKAATA